MGDVSSIKIEIQTSPDTFAKVDAVQIADIADAQEATNSADIEVLNELKKIQSTYLEAKKTPLSVVISPERKLQCTIAKPDYVEMYDRPHFFGQEIICSQYKTVPNAQARTDVFTGVRKYYLEGYASSLPDFISLNGHAAVSVYEYLAPVAPKPSTQVQQPYVERP